MDTEHRAGAVARSAGLEACRQQHLDLDVPERDLGLVLLQDDVAGFREAVVGPRLEFTVRDLCLPRVGPQLVLEQLLAVHPVLDVAPLDHDAAFVPFARRLGDVDGRRIQVVIGTRSAVAVLACFGIRMALVVEQLVLRPGEIARLVARRLDDAVHHAAVAAWGDLPVELEVEAGVLLVARDVGGLADACQRAVLRRPAVRHRRLVVAMPARGRRAVEEQHPAVGLLLRRQRVRTVGSRRHAYCRGREHRQRKHPSHGNLRDVTQWSPVPSRMPMSADAPAHPSTRRRPASGPSTSTAVASISEVVALPATTVTDERPVMG